jgi:two-component system response regulator HydG
VFTFLTMTVGQREGRSFPLEPGVENTIGRGPECLVVLSDPLCSRVHAVLEERAGQWLVRDQSRNGTLVNGQQVAEAVLADGAVLRVGETELIFHHTEQAPTLAAPLDLGLTQTIVRDTPVTDYDSGQTVLAALGDSPEAQDLVLLHQLSVRLVEPREPDLVLRDALEAVRQRCGASSVSFLWADDARHLRTKIVLPPDASERPMLSESLTQLVTGQARAVWIAHQQTRDRAGPQHDADVLCVPLAHEGAVLGALYVYLRQGHFQQSQYDFTIAAANLAAKALVRARGEQQLAAELAQARESLGPGEVLIGESPWLREFTARLASLAGTADCVLLRGERGVGKRAIARLLHREGPRADRPLHVYRSGEHETGSQRASLGDALRRSDMGAIYVDEVGRFTPEEQQMLLQAIEGVPVTLSAGAAAVELHVRVLAGTSIDLAQLTRQGQFAGELQQRLSAAELHVSPLRERREDIEPLAELFLCHFSAVHSQPSLALSEAARQALRDYDWPGNVLELRHVIQLAAATAATPIIAASDLWIGRRAGPDVWESLCIEDWERRLILAALRKASGNVPEAAKLLGIGRATLYRKIEEYGIDRPA